MKTLSAVVLALACIGAAPATHAATHVAVSVGINAPGQYGRIDFNTYPQAVLITQQPVIYLPHTVVVQQPAIYLYVPTVQQVHWGRDCRRYRACGRPVYFVREDWVREQYGRERYQRKHGKGYEQQDRDHDEERGRGGDAHD